MASTASCFSLVRVFFRASLQSETAHRANFWIGLFNALLNLAGGVCGLVIVFARIRSLHGWDLPAALALLGVFLIIGALRNLCIGPSLEALAGAEGEIRNGTFDFTLLRPRTPLFLAAFRHWRPLTLLDLGLGLGVLTAAVVAMGRLPTPGNWLRFAAAMAAAVVILYALLLLLTSLVVFNPGFLFTWAFDAVFQTARYPLEIYPARLRFVLTWVVPVGFMTAVPARALQGRLPDPLLAGAVGLALLLFFGAARLFHRSLRRYTGASG